MISINTYDECLRAILRLRAVKLGLQNTKKMADLLGNPEKSYKIVHVAGTCGKGSVVNKIANCLKIKGYKVGIFTSPHVCSFRERIKINDVLINEEDFILQTNKLLNLSISSGIPITFFEISTLMAFNYFAENTVDWAVIECGIGGTYDATNIIEHPSCAVITSIGWDHMMFLGNTLEKISKDKAGIIKSGCPVVLGPTASCHKIFYEKSHELGCQIIEVPFEPRGESFDQENSRTTSEVILKALKLDMLPNQLAEGISYRLPLRLQILNAEQVSNVMRRIKVSDDMCLDSKINNFVPIPIILDVGHNETAIDRICREIGFLYYGRPIMTCVSLSKERNISIFEPIVNHFHHEKNNRLVGIYYIEGSSDRLKSKDIVINELESSEISPILKSYIRNGIQISDRCIEEFSHKNEENISPLFF